MEPDLVADSLGNGRVAPGLVGEPASTSQTPLRSRIFRKVDTGFPQKV